MVTLRLSSERGLGRALLMFGAVLYCASTVQAQRGGRGGAGPGNVAGGDCNQRFGNGRAYGGGEPVIKNVPYDARFTFVRLTYVPGPGGYYYAREPSWAHGYWENFPDEAEINLMQIMQQVSLFHPHVRETNAIAIDDPELFKYPIAYLTEAAYWDITTKETLALRKYLVKGGFLIIDDSRDDFDRGKTGWVTLNADLVKLFPNLHPIKLDNSYPIFHSFFDFDTPLQCVPQAYDRVPPEFYGLFEDNDPKKRMYMIINFNTDISDFWEFTQEGFYPIESSNDAYKLGVNYIIYALTH